MRSISAICIGLALASGCTSTVEWEGSWHGRRQLSGDQSVTPASRQLGELKLTVFRQGRFSLVDASMPKAGSYWVDQGTLKLQVDEVGGRPVISSGDIALNPPITLERQPDGSLLYIDPAAFDKKPVRLIRDAQPSQ